MAAHRYWGVQCWAAPSGQVGIGELQMMDAPGGVNLCTGGTPGATGTYGGSYSPSSAFDGNTATNWFQGGGWGYLGAILWYDFGSNPVNWPEINEFRMCPGAEDLGGMPRIGALVRSDDASAWTEEYYFYKTDWVAQTFDTFTRPTISATNRWWGILVQNTGNGQRDLVISELGMHETLGGPTVTGSGTPSYYPENGSYPAAQAFDGNTATLIYAGVTGRAVMVRYDFGSGQDKTLAEIAITSSDGGGGNNQRAPSEGLIVFSPDGKAWLSAGSIAAPFGYGSIETKLFEVSAAPPDPHPLLTQGETLVVERGVPRPRATQALAYVIEALIADPVGRLTQGDVLVVENLSETLTARATQALAYVVERTRENPEDEIEWQDRAWRADAAGLPERRFIDLYPPVHMGEYPANATPRWSDRVSQSDSGDTLVTPRWDQPLMRFSLPEAVRDQETLEAVRDHWLIMGGPAHTWPFRNPLDYASCALDEAHHAAPGPLDQVLGAGNGVRTRFQLIKRYSRGAQNFDRIIRLPVAGSVVVSVNGVQIGHEHWTVSRRGGIVQFLEPPPLGQIVRAGFLFDHEVRFEDDDGFEAMQQSWAASGYGALTLIEVRETPHG